MNELDSLISKMLEGNLTSGEGKRLESILTNDPDARAVYIVQCQLHARLEKDATLKDATRAETPIDLDDVPDEERRIPQPARRIPAYIGTIAASVAISFIGIISYLNFSSSGKPDGFVNRPELQSSPEKTYENAAFPESGNLKRPPTNFAAISPQTGREKVSFNRDIRPIISENCYACHGPDAESREAELRLDIEANAFVAHGEFDPAIVRGDPGNSPLYKRITSSQKSDIMPPPDSHKSLTDSEIELIGQWIDEGAKWEGHWAFVQPQKPDVPKIPWGVNEIDAFLYQSMQDKGLSPNKEADRPTLARRLSLDLTGLPATPELVQEFVDDASANAYERLVDKLLATTAYGEHQARYWLDAARYADTHGLHLDNYREIWPYRDWVINAFNENKPFDAFTREQIAGDLLPKPTLQQQLATGFNRCNPTTSEGGAIDEEYRAIYAKDRVETTATVFMGLTMGCASCHDHKFDPFSMTDFYRFSAFFNNFDGPIMDGNAYDTRPIVTIPKEEHSVSWINVTKERERLNQAVEKIKNEKRADFHAWKADDNREYKLQNVKSEIAFELRFNSSGDNDKDSESALPPKIAEASMGDQVDLRESGFDFDPNKPFTVTCELKFPVEEGKKQKRIPVIEQFDGDRGWRLSIMNSDITFPNRYQVTFELIHSLKENNLISATTKSERANPREFSSTTINVTYDGSGSVAGLAISTNSRQPFEYDKVVDNLSGTVSVGSPLQAGFFAGGIIDPQIAAKNYKTGLYDKSGDGTKAGAIKKIQFYGRPIYAFESSSQSTVKRVKELLNTPEDRHRDRDKDQIESYYYSNFVPEYRELKYTQAVNDQLYNHIYDQATVSLVMEEKDSPPTARILERGEYDKPGEKVLADIPEFLGRLPANAPKNRLGLANWLVDANNPLTARVTVNRFWQNIFGTGIVATSEDFGAMGENPTHPELLDWIALSFQENGWDVKRLLKSFVVTAAYKQESTILPEELAIDRENRFLARGSRYRLDGEVLRDKILYVSGSLNQKFGGSPVKPYQPEGIWNTVAYSDSNTAHFSQDHGSDVYRRSLYTFWKRTAPPPNMVVFDVPSRENCNVRRERTNTPLQALTLMNDPQFVEAARQLAERVMVNHKGSSSERISHMYTYAFGSEPVEKHHEILERSYSKFYSSFVEERSNANQFIQIGESSPRAGLDPVELASLTMVANQIMNLDSFINKY